MDEFSKHRNKLPQVRHIVIDEAQSIKTKYNWFTKCDSIRKQNAPDKWNPGYFWVFCDLTQDYIKRFDRRGHTTKKSYLPAIKDQGDNIHVLKDVVRNSRRIHRLSYSFYQESGYEISSSWATGSIISARPCEFEAFEEFVWELLKRNNVPHKVDGDIIVFFIQEESVKPVASCEVQDHDVHIVTDVGVILDTIARNLIDHHGSQDSERPFADLAVLTFTEKQAEQMRSKLEVDWGIQTTTAAAEGAMEGHRLIVDHVLEFGGLEKPVIVFLEDHMTGINSLDNRPMALYIVAYSRAMYKLILGLTGERLTGGLCDVEKHEFVYRYCPDFLRKDSRLRDALKIK